MRRSLRYVFYFFLVMVLLLAGVLTYFTITEYDPDAVEVVSQNDVTEVIETGVPIDFMTWNLGYCGLGSEMDFFYDGGEMVIPEEGNVVRNLREIKKTVQANDSIEFFLFQEVDVDSKRTYRINEVDSLLSVLRGYWSAFAYNYLAEFVPIPVTNPLGHFGSGLLSASSYDAFYSARYSYAGNFTWPKKIFMLDRCFLVCRYRTSNNSELVVVNTHNSAYDDGSLRVEQMGQLRDFLEMEYSKGNYVIAGGDWNQSPPGYAVDADPGFPKVSNDFIPDWKWVFDHSVTTNRTIEKPYVRGENTENVIDFFLISPNVLNILVKGLPLGFENSDHNPVVGRFILLD